MATLTTLMVVIACVACVMAQLTPVEQALVKNMVSMRDTTVDPCTDFFQYACGTYIKENPIPANVTRPTILLPTITGIMYGTDALLAEIVEGDWPLISDMYQSCLQTDAAEIGEFVTSQAQRIDAINVQDANQLFQLIVELNTIGTPAFMQVQAYFDDYQISHIFISPSGNTVPFSQYSNNQTYNLILNEIITGFELFEDSASAAADATAVIGVEMAIAKVLTATTFDNTTVGVLSAQTGLNFLAILSQMGLDVTANTIVLAENVDYLASIPKFAASYPAKTIQRFFEWKIFQYLDQMNVTGCWDNAAPQEILCYAVMEDSPYPPPWDQPAICRNFVHLVLQDYIGMIFSSEIVNDYVVASIHNMTYGIQNAFNNTLPTLSWLDQFSLPNVQNKLDNIVQIIGHPNVVDRYENFTTSPTMFVSNFYSLTIVVGKFNYYENTVPFNRTDFEFDPMVVNAFYSPNTNTINFPAGILESPMYSASWPKLFQYARLGYVVGHENTHGFDNQGSEWSANGTPGDIFDSATRTNFNNNAQCIATYYSNFTVYNNTKINGEQTLGENIADIGGVKNSYRAYQNYVTANGPEYGPNELIPGLTTNQVFFLFLGQTWCSNANLAYLEFQLQDDVHSPAHFRVVGPLSQFDQFAAAYSCPANSPMNPANRCNLW